MRAVGAPICLVLLILGSAALPAQARKASFVDEGLNDASLVAFRETLLEAIAARDVDKVVAAAAPDIRLDPGGGSGRNELRRRLTVTAEDFSDNYANLADEHREQYWDALEEALRLGGMFRQTGVFVAPYTSSVELRPAENAFTTSFIIGADVPLRARPSRFGDIIALLDEDVVQMLDGGRGTDFVEIETADGRRGYVHKDELRSAIDYTVIIEKRDGRWLIAEFVAGDVSAE